MRCRSRPLTNPATTPQNNSIAGLPSGAFTPQTDRTVIAPSAGKRPTITTVVPGVQVQARIASDPTGEARFLLRLPDNWNGRLVVAGASGTRSEFNGDFAWSDYVVQKGYAYASQNKGVLNLRITSLSSVTPPNALACRLNPASGVWVNFYDNDDGQQFTRWVEYMVKAGQIAQEGVKSAYGHAPRYLRSRHLERRLSGSTCARDGSQRYSMAASTGKARSSTSTRRISSPICRRPS